MKPSDVKPSYDEAIWTTVAHIPEGKVATYGQIATIAGFPGTARAVGRSLSKLPEGSKIPWHRVINSKGTLSFPVDSDRYAEQKKRLQEEDICLNAGKINLPLNQWEL